MATRLFFLLLVLSGCTCQRPNHCKWTEQCLSSRTGYTLSQPCWASELLLNEPLTVENAVQLALLNNPELKGYFHSIGVSQSELLEACLISNPIFEATTRYPNESSRYWNTELNLAVFLLDFFLRPLKMRVGRLEVQEAELAYAQQALSLIYQIQEAYYNVSALESSVKLYSEVVHHKELMVEVAEKQFKAGNINELAVAEHKAVLERAKIDHLHMISSKQESIEYLVQLMGLPCFKVEIATDNAISITQLNKNKVEHLALSNRIDLMKQEVKICKLTKTKPLFSPWVYTQLYGGVSSEIEPDGLTVTGPAIAMEIPIFNYGQADREKLGFEIQRDYCHYTHLVQNALFEVRQALIHLEYTLDQMEESETHLIPSLDVAKEQTLLLYNVMNAGVYELLESNVELLEAKIQLIDQKRDYLIARAQLDYAVGGALVLEQ